MTPYLAGMRIGFILGFGAHHVILQIAYRIGIVEYKGLNK